MATFYVTSNYANAGLACGQDTGGIPLYTNDPPQAGNFVYTDPGQSNIYIGNNDYQGFDLAQGVPPTYAVRVNNLGEILDVVDCLSLTTSTTTTTTTTTTAAPPPPTTTVTPDPGVCYFIWVLNGQTAYTGVRYSPPGGTATDVLFSGLLGTPYNYNGNDGIVYAFCSTLAPSALVSGGGTAQIGVATEPEIYDVTYGALQVCNVDGDCTWVPPSTTTTTTTAAGGRTLVTLGYDLSVAADACADEPTGNQYYIDGATLALSTAIYTHPTNNTYPAAGTYSDGVTWAYFNGSVIQNDGACPSTTTSTTAAPPPPFPQTCLPPTGPLSFGDFNDAIGNPTQQQLAIDTAGIAFDLDTDPTNWSDATAGLGMDEFYGECYPPVAPPPPSTTATPPPPGTTGAPTFYAHSLGYDVDVPGEACTAGQTGYFSNCALLSVGCYLYSTEDANDPVSDGIYSDGTTAYTVSFGGEITAAQNCPGVTTTTSTTTTTTTTTAAPGTTWYRFTSCDANPEVWQVESSEPTFNSRWYDGVNYYVYDGTSTTTTPSPVVSNLVDMGTTGCPSTTTSTTTAAQTAKIQVQACTGGPFLGFEITNYSSIPLNFAVVVSGTCYLVIDDNWTGTIDSTTTADSIESGGCSSGPCAPTTTTTTTAAPILCTQQDLGSGATGEDACDSYDLGFRVTRYMDDFLATATVLYRDSNCGPAVGAAGWYSDGVEYRYWDGISFGPSSPCGGGGV